MCKSVNRSLVQNDKCGEKNFYWKYMESPKSTTVSIFRMTL